MSYGRPEITEHEIKCEECGKWFKKIVPGHLKKHGLTTAEYKRRWGFMVSQPLESHKLNKLRSWYNKEYEMYKQVLHHPGRKPFKKGETVKRDISEQERIKLASMAINVQHTEAFRKSHSVSSKKMWQDPAYRAKSIASYKKKYGTPKMKKEMSKRARAYWKQPEVRAKASEQRKEYWNTPEAKAYCSERSKRSWADPKIRAKILESRKLRYIKN